MISPASTSAARCRRSVAGAMPWARMESSRFDGNTTIPLPRLRMRHLLRRLQLRHRLAPCPSSPAGQRQRRLLVKAQERVQDRERSIGDAESAPSLRSARETVAIYGRPVRTRLGVAAKSFVAAWLATMASDSDRRPKGVVECVCMILCLVQAKEICSPKRRRTLDSDSRKWILSGC